MFSMLVSKSKLLKIDIQFHIMQYVSRISFVFVFCENQIKHKVLGNYLYRIMLKLK